MSTYIKPEDRKTILFIGDDLRLFTGIGVMSRSIVYRSADHFNWIQIGVKNGITKEEILKPIDISEEVNKEMNYTDSNVIILPDVTYEGMYSCMNSIRNVMSSYKIDAILFFTDPRYYEWLFANEKEIRSRVPLVYLNIWDNLPYPMWNKPFYESCDGLMAISKQTFNINRQILRDCLSEKVIKYVPHGIEDYYFPMDPNEPELINFKNNLWKGDIPDFVLFFNARNMWRKNISDLIMAWKLFTDTLTDEKARKCRLLLHCNPVDINGTDLYAVHRDNCDTNRCLINFISDNVSFHDLNLLYNSSDGVVLPSYAEGWGLSITEAMKTGKMFIATVTGGMQDQMRFQDENGRWIDFSLDFPTNSVGKYVNHGEWCIPVWPANARTVGSPRTPYIYEDSINIEDLFKAIKELYELGPDERLSRGMKGCEWANSEEAGFTAKSMAEKMIDGIEETIEKFTPKDSIELFKVERDNSAFINRNIIWKKWKETSTV